MVLSIVLSGGFVGADMGKRVVLGRGVYEQRAAGCAGVCLAVYM